MTSQLSNDFYLGAGNFKSGKSGKMVKFSNTSVTWCFGKSCYGQDSYSKGCWSFSSIVGSVIWSD